MPLTKRQLTRAARLYALAVLSNQDVGGADTEEQSEVRDLAIANAGKALIRLGYEPTELNTIDHCIEAAKAKR